PAPAPLLYTLSLHDALPISPISSALRAVPHKVPVLFAAMGLVAIAYVVLPVIALASRVPWGDFASIAAAPSTLELLKTTVSAARSEEHTSELQSRFDLVCRL